MIGLRLENTNFPSSCQHFTTIFQPQYWRSCKGQTRVCHISGTILITTHPQKSVLEGLKPEAKGLVLLCLWDRFFRVG